jgi:hypothetical protein
MLYGIKVVTKYLLGLDVAERGMTVYPDDTFIVSYPRSGNTWTRFLIANLLHPEEPVSFANIERVIPDATALSSRAMKRVPRPRIVKTHEYFDPRYRKAVYLVRDPRDVVVSQYQFRRKNGLIEDSYPIERYVSECFIPGDLDVSWGEHVGSWLGARRNHPGFLLVRYEDLQRDVSTELTKIGKLLGVEVTPERIATAVERSGAQRMRELEKAEHERWVTTKGSRADIPFIGAAKSGRWRESLPGAAAALIESEWGELMESLGYEVGGEASNVARGEL